MSVDVPYNSSSVYTSDGQSMAREDAFSMPFNEDPENISAELQLEIIEMQCSTHLKQWFLNSTKLDFYRALPKTEFPKIIAHAQKIVAMFPSTYVCE
ncbi:general transcription factor II-I repeat domain-containing protein 2B [Nephila pilipes]|uniref:General transcription factor II-I repeat domain-containing protein 2B n=1 Tax=Nephila pilipes TaxID=299642 RepID=A0A8X6PKN2_NEPPI|nr:general transcription factor II-I repeat domain-containing protein 2B [Nephila pilipes]